MPNFHHFVMVKAKSKKWRNEEVQVKWVKKERISYRRPRINTYVQRKCAASPDKFTSA